MKHFKHFLLAVLVALTGSVTTYAYDFESDGIYYTINSDESTTQSTTPVKKKRSFLDKLSDALDAVGAVTEAINNTVNGNESSTTNSLASHDMDEHSSRSASNSAGCSNCNYTGQIVCSLCNRGVISCKTCNGSGRTWGYDTRSHKKAYVACSTCHGAGSFKCNACKGTGYIPCKYCKPQNNEQTDGNYNGSSSNKRKCVECQGSGRCSHCAGRGEKRNQKNNQLYDCMFCKGTGKCQHCRGFGYRTVSSN